MTPLDFFEVREQLKTEIEKYKKALHDLEMKFINEHRQLTDPCLVAHDGWPYRFTGDVYVDGTCTLQYELKDRCGCLIYVQFEDLEVIQ